MEASEADINEALGLGEASSEEPNTEQEEGNQEEPQYSEVELKAMDQGWRPKDEYEGNPDDWKSAKTYVEIGELRSHNKNLSNQVKGMKKSYSEEITNLNMLHKLQLDSKEKELNQRLATAVEEGDLDKVQAINAEIKDVEKASDIVSAPRETSDPKNDLLIQRRWELKNTWIHEDTPKSNAAKSAFELAQMEGKTVEEALEFVEEAVGNQFPDKQSNPNRKRPSGFDSSGAIPRSREKKLSFEDLPRQYQDMLPAFVSKEDLIKAYQNSNK